VAQSSGGGGDGASGRTSRDGDKPGDDAKTSSSKNSEVDARNAADDENDRKDDADGVLYDESYHPPFLWALILFPPVLPLFWYVSRVGRTRPSDRRRSLLLQFCRSHPPIQVEGGKGSISLDRFSHGFSYRLPVKL
jgi:hypothetical protein